jgi:hypothetical protein
MMKWSPLLALLLSLAVTTGCKSGETSDSAARAEPPPVAKKFPKESQMNPDAAPVEWPAAPADGSELSVRFVKMIGSGKRLGAQMRLFNFSGSGATEVDLILSYLGADNTVLSTFKTKARGFPIVAARGQALYPMGGQTPPKTTRVTAEVIGVTRSDVVWGKSVKTKIIAPSPAPPSAKPPTGTP